MAMDYSICLGTAGWGVWHSPDAGQSWVRHRAPFPLNSRIQALVVHPTEPHTVLAGGDTGLFVSRNGGAQWERVGAPGDLPTETGHVLRSTDFGETWEMLQLPVPANATIWGLATHPANASR